MTTYRLAPAAQRDLTEIWDFTEDRWDAHQAQIYIGEIWAAVERIAADPHRGRARDEIQAGFYSYAVARHVLFYIQNLNGVDEIRILHQRMDPFRHI